MPGSWADYLELRSGADAPPPSSEAGDVRVYADSDGALRAVQSDGTDAAVGGGGSASARGAFAYLTDNVDEFHRGTIPFDAVDFDTDDFFDPVTHLVTVPAGMAGLYLANLMVDAFAVDASLPFGNLIIGTSGDLNGSGLYMPRNAGDTSWVGSISCLMRLAEGDTIWGQLGWVTEDDGLFVTLFGGLDGPNFFSVVYLGAVA